MGVGVGGKVAVKVMVGVGVGVNPGGIVAVRVIVGVGVGQLNDVGVGQGTLRIVLTPPL